MVLSEGTTAKIPSDTTGTVRLVAQRLNHYATPGPRSNPLVSNNFAHYLPSQKDKVKGE